MPFSSLFSETDVCMCVSPCQGTLSLFLNRLGGVPFDMLPLTHLPACA